MDAPFLQALIPRSSKVVEQGRNGGEVVVVLTVGGVGDAVGDIITETVGPCVGWDCVWRLQVGGERTWVPARRVGVIHRGCPVVAHDVERSRQTQYCVVRQITVEKVSRVKTHVGVRIFFAGSAERDATYFILGGIERAILVGLVFFLVFVTPRALRILGPLDHSADGLLDQHSVLMALSQDHLFLCSQEHLFLCQDHSFHHVREAIALVGCTRVRQRRGMGGRELSRIVFSRRKSSVVLLLFLRGH